MADFIRFKANGRTVLVNAERIAFVSAHIDRHERDVPVFDEARTNINFAGSDIDYIVVDEPFEDVCAKLTRVR